MSAPLSVCIVSSAAQAIAEAAKWWIANRPKAPTAFVVDLERALQLIAFQPAIGARATNIKLIGVRRVPRCSRALSFVLPHYERAGNRSAGVMAYESWCPF